MGSGDVDPTALGGVELIKKVIAKYNDTSALKMGVKKEVKLSLLEETRASNGLLYFSKGLMRLEIIEPEKSIIVLNKDAIWVETSSEGFDGPTTHVTKIVSKDLKKRSKAPLVLLLTETEAWDNFKVISEKATEKETTMILRPKKKGEYPELSKVSISINTLDNELWTVSYEDEIENVVTYKFHRPDFGAKLSKGKFDYKVPKGVTPTVYR